MLIWFAGQGSAGGALSGACGALKASSGGVVSGVAE